MRNVKMNLLLNGIVLLLLAAFFMPHSEAAVARGIFKDDAHPGKCYVKPNLILNAGQSANYPDMECARIVCEDNSMAQIQTCGVMMPPPGCKLGAAKHPTADYPKCCDRQIVCANNCASTTTDM